MVEQQTRNYELMMIVSPEANEDEIRAAAERVSSFIAERGGIIYDQANWGLRRLAYPIQKFNEGNYVLTRFALEPAVVIDLDDRLKASDDVMRHLTMKLDKTIEVAPPEPEPEPEQAEQEPETPEEPTAQVEEEPTAQAEPEESAEGVAPAQTT